MPTLGLLRCHLKWQGCEKPIQEHAIEYSDSHVQTYIPVPPNPTPFFVHVSTEGYIATGLSAFVYIDGEYQCNRGRRGIKYPGQGVNPAEICIDMKMRQKEVTMADGAHWGMPWMFKQVNAAPPGLPIPENLPWGGLHVGTIEVVILRHAPDTSSVPSGLMTAKTRQAWQMQMSAVPYKGPPRFGVDGAWDDGDDEVQERPAKRAHLMCLDGDGWGDWGGGNTNANNGNQTATMKRPSNNGFTKSKDWGQNGPPTFQSTNNNGRSGSRNFPSSSQSDSGRPRGNTVKPGGSGRNGPQNSSFDQGKHRSARSEIVTRDDRQENLPPKQDTSKGGLFGVLGNWAWSKGADSKLDTDAQKHSSKKSVTPGPRDETSPPSRRGSIPVQNITINVAAGGSATIGAPAPKTPPLSGSKGTEAPTSPSGWGGAKAGIGGSSPQMPGAWDDGNDDGWSNSPPAQGADDSWGNDNPGQGGLGDNDNGNANEQSGPGNNVNFDRANDTQNENENTNNNQSSGDNWGGFGDSNNNPGNQNSASRGQSRSSGPNHWNNSNNSKSRQASKSGNPNRSNRASQSGPFNGNKSGGQGRGNSNSQSQGNNGSGNQGSGWFRNNNNNLNNSSGSNGDWNKNNNANENNGSWGGCDNNNDSHQQNDSWANNSNGGAKNDDWAANYDNNNSNSDDWGANDNNKNSNDTDWGNGNQNTNSNDNSFSNNFGGNNNDTNSGGGWEDSNFNNQNDDNDFGNNGSNANNNNATSWDAGNDNNQSTSWDAGAKNQNTNQTNNDSWANDSQPLNAPPWGHGSRKAGGDTRKPSVANANQTASPAFNTAPTLPSGDATWGAAPNTSIAAPAPVAAKPASIINMQLSQQHQAPAAIPPPAPTYIKVTPQPPSRPALQARPGLFSSNPGSLPKPYRAAWKQARDKGLEISRPVFDPRAGEQVTYSLPQEVMERNLTTHQVQLGAASQFSKARFSPKYLDTVEKPFAVFTFHYRDQETLSAMLGVPVRETQEEEAVRLKALPKEDILQIMYSRLASAAASQPPAQVEQPPSFERSRQASQHVMSGAQPAPVAVAQQQQMSGPIDANDLSARLSSVAVGQSGGGSGAAQGVKSDENEPGIAGQQGVEW